jgi:hypothetical protein
VRERSRGGGGIEVVGTLGLGGGGGGGGGCVFELVHVRIGRVCLHLAVLGPVLGQSRSRRRVFGRGSPRFGAVERGGCRTRVSMRPIERDPASISVDCASECFPVASDSSRGLRVPRRATWGLFLAARMFIRVAVSTPPHSGGAAWPYRALYAMFPSFPRRTERSNWLREMT